MNEARVDDLLDRIDQLPEEDRQLLELRMAERTEAQWRQEMLAARDEARRRGIDDATIEQAIEELRYPTTGAIKSQFNNFRFQSHGEDQSNSFSRSCLHAAERSAPFADDVNAR